MQHYNIILETLAILTHKINLSNIISYSLKTLFSVVQHNKFFLMLGNILTISCIYADLLEARNSQGMTPLFQSVSCNNLECVQFLVTSGANIDTRDNVGRTPVALAAYQV